MARFKIYDTAVKPETAVLVSVITPDVSDETAKEYLEELEFLVTTAGGVTKGIFTQKLAFPDRATFVGSGKLDEIKEFIQAEEIDIVVFDDFGHLCKACKNSAGKDPSGACPTAIFIA